LARDLAHLDPQWDVIREPEAVQAGATLIFPDLALVRRGPPERRFLVEVMGYWTPEYVHHKLARLRAARLDNLVFCVDEARNCGNEGLPLGAEVVRFARRVDARAVLAAIARLEGGSAPARRAAP